MGAAASSFTTQYTLFFTLESFNTPVDIREK